MSNERNPTRDLRQSLLDPGEIGRKRIVSSHDSEEPMLVPDDPSYPQSKATSFNKITSVPSLQGDRSSIGNDASSIRLGRSEDKKSWRPGFWVRLPILGIAALVAALVCTMAAAIISVRSNRQIVTSWKVSPTVLFSIVSSLSNVLLSFSLAEGLVISFWSKALRGATLQGLHNNWHSGTSFSAAVLAGLRGQSKVNSLACALTTLSILRGPLLQKSINLVPGFPIPTSGNMTIDLGQSIPDIYGGIAVYSRNLVHTVAMQTPNFTTIMQSYSTHSTMTIDHPPCGRSCSTQIQGFGFRVDCNIHNQALVEDREKVGWSSNYFSTSVEFYIDPDMEGLENPIPMHLVLNATYLPTNYTRLGNTGSISTMILLAKSCNLYGGVVSYDVVLENGTVHLKYDDWRQDRFVKEVEMLGPTSRNPQSSVIGGFQYAANYLFNSSAFYTFAGAVQTYSLEGVLANQFMTGSPDTYEATWEDPTDYVINQLRDIAFRTSLQAAKDNAIASNATQNVRYVGSNTGTILETNFGLVGVAVILNLLAILAISLTYRRWWTLGRKFTGSPLEMARAFDAPLLRDTYCNATLEQILEQGGGLKLRYGEVSRETGDDGREVFQLLFEKERDVRYPRAGSIYYS